MTIANESLTEQNSSYLDDAAGTVHQLDISMLDLFTMLGLESAEYEHAHDISHAGITVKTPNGWQPVQALVRKHTATARYLLANDLDLTCATKHLVFEHSQCKTINTCTSIDTLDGPVEIIGSEYLGESDLYDISIPAPHVYVTTNGIIHHNTTLAKCLFHELGVDDMDIKYINASQNTGIDYLRSLTGFVETMPMGEFRYVLLDECLDEKTIVWVLRNGIELGVAIKDLDQSSDLVKSYSVENQRIEWRPFELMDKGNREVLEIEFENGEVVVCTPNHKWYVEDPATGENKVVRTDELDQYEHILTI